MEDPSVSHHHTSPAAALSAQRWRQARLRQRGQGQGQMLLAALETERRRQIPRRGHVLLHEDRDVQETLGAGQTFEAVQAPAGSAWVRQEGGGSVEQDLKRGAHVKGRTTVVAGCASVPGSWVGARYRWGRLPSSVGNTQESEQLSSIRTAVQHRGPGSGSWSDNSITERISQTLTFSSRHRSYLLRKKKSQEPGLGIGCL